MDSPLECELAYKAVQQLRIGAWEIDLKTGRPLWSKVVYDIHEVPYDFVPNLEEAINFYAPEARPVIEASVQKAMGGGDGWNLEVPFITAKGRRIWVHAVGNVDLDDGGRPLRIYGTFQDVTDRVLADQKTRSLSERVFVASHHGGIGVWEWDVLKDELIWDDQMYLLYGVEKDVGREAYETWRQSLHSEDLERSESLLNAALKGDKEFFIEFRVIWPDGSEHWIKASGKVVWDDGGQPLRMVGVNQDITHQKRIEEQLERDKEALQRANEAKSQFLSVMSHELRTPLNIVMGVSRMVLDEGGMADHNVENLKMIHKAGEDLNGVIGSILDYAQSESSALPFADEPCQILDIVASVSEGYREKIEAKGLSFELTTEMDAKSSLCFDVRRLEQLLGHLLMNAMKFTEEGFVSVVLQQYRKSGGFVGICLEVSDSGKGIGSAEQEVIFEPFYQEDMRKSRSREGIGLGLALCRSIVQHYFGNLEVDSREGEGATFRAYMLMKKSSQLEKDDFEQPKRRLVMVVEDNEANIKLVKKVLKKLGQDVVVAENGEEAISKYSEHKPDFIFMDLSMPVMDGFEAARMIRLMDRVVPIYALTANVLDTDVEKCYQVGMNGHLSKPIRVSRLRKALLDHQ
jgi:signal transduction histidine kinase/CheY-like chemotaxis protein